MWWRTRFNVTDTDVSCQSTELEHRYVVHLPEKDVDQDDNVEHQIKDRERMFLQTKTQINEFRISIQSMTLN